DDLHEARVLPERLKLRPKPGVFQGREVARAGPGHHDIEKLIVAVKLAKALHDPHEPRRLGSGNGKCEGEVPVDVLAGRLGACIKGQPGALPGVWGPTGPG